MRITNSMMINTVLTDLNTGLLRQNKYFQQLASNRKMVNLSDNPIGLINSLNARQNLRQIEQYRTNIVTTRKWTQQAETSIMDMESVIVKIKENVVDAGGTKNPTDKKNISSLVKELKDHLFQTVNSAVGDKFLFGGFNSTKKPFTMDKDGKVLYNGINLGDTAPIAGDMTAASGDIMNPKLTGSIDPPDNYIVKKLSDNQIEVTNVSGSLKKTIDFSVAKINQTKILDANGVATGVYKNTLDIELNDLKVGTLEWETTVEEKDGQSTLKDALDTLVSNPDGPEAPDAPGVPSGKKITCGLYKTMTEAVVVPKPLEPLGGLTKIEWQGPITAGDKYYVEADSTQITIKDSKGTEIVKTNVDSTKKELDLSQYGLGTIKWEGSATAMDIASSIASATYVTTKLGEEAAQDIQFEIGYQIRASATFTGIEVVGLGEDNMFKILDDLIADLDAGAGNEDLTKYLTRLTTVQDRLLKCGVELGARTQKLDTMENRYSMDNINAEAVRGNIEDIDQAETIMNMKFAEAIYKQALAAGAMIIQPTLMDFLN